jgi:hypothetical protein
MKPEQLNRIIGDKNIALENAVYRNAEDLIESIVREQRTIAACTDRITKLRDELKALEVTQLDPSTILGGV